MNKIIISNLFGLSLIISVGCTSAVRFSSTAKGAVEYSKPAAKNNQQTTNQIEPGTTYTGIASYYGNEFDGRMTASGEVFDQSKYTAAHRTLPFGTAVMVKNLRNGKTVVVRINDRGPFTSGRVIDLSRVAAEAIGMVQTGTAEVELTVVE